MDHVHHHHHAGGVGAPESLNRVAMVATLHCLMGCAIGEVAGLAIGTYLGWGNLATIATAVLLAFVSGFGLTMLPFLRRGYTLGAAVRVALAADAASIGLMELVDNAVMLLIPGAMDAAVTSVHFWASMGVSLLVAGILAFPLNRWLISRGKGHALAHA